MPGFALYSTFRGWWMETRVYDCQKRSSTRNPAIARRLYRNGTKSGRILKSQMRWPTSKFLKSGLFDYKPQIRIRLKSFFMFANLQNLRRKSIFRWKLLYNILYFLAVTVILNGETRISLSYELKRLVMNFSWLHVSVRWIIFVKTEAGAVLIAAVPVCLFTHSGKSWRTTWAQKESYGGTLLLVTSQYFSTPCFIWNRSIIMTRSRSSLAFRCISFTVFCTFS